MRYEIEIDEKDVNNIYIMNKDGDASMVAKHIPVKPIKKDNSRKRWRADYSDYYYYIMANGEIHSESELLTNVDDEIYNLGNYYRTMEEAQFALERQKVLNELELYTAKELSKDTPYWTLICNRDDDKFDIYVSGRGYTIKTEPIMFASEEDATAAIEAVGIERLEKYFFRVVEEEEE